MWKQLDGYFFTYRINEDAVVERLTPYGKWKPMKLFLYQPKKNVSYVILSVRIKLKTGGFSNVPVKRLMRQAFFPNLPPDIRLGVRNGMCTDCSLVNLYPMTMSDCGKKGAGANRRSIEKVDREGNVVALYSSTVEAAKANYISRKSLWRRLNNTIEDPYYLDGYTYRYEKVEGEKL